MVSAEVTRDSVSVAVLIIRVGVAVVAMLLAEATLGLVSILVLIGRLEAIAGAAVERKAEVIT